MASEDRFGYEWNKYSNMDPNYEIQFSRWVAPLSKNDFQERSVLDAGCGMGRNSYWAMKWGAKLLLAFDFDKRSVAKATKTLSSFKYARVEFQSIYDLVYEDRFDITFSIGVIHHLEKPKEAIVRLVRATKPGGKVLIWVYSYEGNEWIVKFVNPIRKLVTSKLPVGMVHFLSHFVSIPLWIFVKIFRGPSSYLRQLSTFRFSHVHSIVFDQLIPKVANYWTKQQAVELFEGIDEVVDVQIHRPDNNMGWTVIGTKKIALGIND